MAFFLHFRLMCSALPDHGYNLHPSEQHQKDGNRKRKNQNRAIPYSRRPNLERINNANSTIENTNPFRRSGRRSLAMHTRSVNQNLPSTPKHSRKSLQPIYAEGESPKYCGSPETAASMEKFLKNLFKNSQVDDHPGDIDLLTGDCSRLSIGCSSSISDNFARRKLAFWTRTKLEGNNFSRLLRLISRESTGRNWPV